MTVVDFFRVYKLLAKMTGNEKSVAECSVSLHRIQVVSQFKRDFETATLPDCEEKQVRSRHLTFSHSDL